MRGETGIQKKSGKMQRWVLKTKKRQVSRGGRRETAKRQANWKGGKGWVKFEWVLGRDLGMIGILDQVGLCRIDLGSDGSPNGRG